MAYTFAKSPDHSYLRTTASPPVQWGPGESGTGFSVSLWFNAANATEAHTLLRLEHGGTNNRYILSANGAADGDPVRFISQIGEAFYTVSQSSYTAATWQHVFAATWTQDTDTTLYIALNGAASMALQLEAQAPTAAESYVQISGDNIFIPAIDGAIAEVAIYGGDLTLSDARFALADGFAPSRVHPHELIFYAPLIRGLQDISSSNTLTAYNTPVVSAHPPIKA